MSQVGKDKIIWDELVRKYANTDNIIIIDFSIRNKDLLDLLHKDVILISHHGNALLEGASLGFKCICSESSPWQRFDLFNSWGSRKEYMRMLSNPRHLRRVNLDDLYSYLANLYTHSSSYGGVHAWSTIVANECGITPGELFKNPSSVNDLSQEGVDNAILAISDNIFHLNINKLRDVLKSLRHNSRDQ